MQATEQNIEQSAEQNFDGSIESAVDLILEPEKVDQEETEEVEDEESTESPVDQEDEESDPEGEEEDIAEGGDKEEADEDEQDDSDEGDSEAPKLYTVKVDGEDVEVTLEELQRGYSGQRYVQKGMQEAAEKRKEVEAVYSSLLEERKQVAQLYQQLQENPVRPPDPPSKELFDRDPIGYMEQKLAYDEQMEQYQKQVSEIERITQRQAEYEQQSMQAYLQHEVEQLRATVPEFANDESAAKLRDKMIKIGAEYGYSPEEISGVIDHRALRVMRDAIKYREIQEGKSKAVQKASKKPVLKPGVKKASSAAVKKQRERMARLKNTGSIDDAVKLILSEQ